VRYSESRGSEYLTPGLARNENDTTSKRAMSPD
jgi:hypothetical protein